MGGAQAGEAGERAGVRDAPLLGAGKRISAAHDDIRPRLMRPVA
jgi:hypothetical protein